MIKEFIKQYYKDFVPYKTDRWCYEDGILLEASIDLYKATKDTYFRNFVVEYLDKYINSKGEAQGYKPEEYSMDDIEPANSLFFAHEVTHNKKYLRAEDIFYKQIENQPRCKCGNFFHKNRYPYQVWMDGLYMGQPFYLTYTLEHHLDKNIDDSLEQFRNVRKYLFDEKRYLYVHAYDENKVMQWADKKTGKSANSWSRACGWMLMAMVNVIEIMGVNNPKIDFLKVQLREMINGILPHLDPDTYMMYQVVDAGDEKGNYLETSGSSMLAYSMLKANRLGILNEDYAVIAGKIFMGICKTYLKKNKDNKITLGGICQVAGLDNEKRNGSKEYYYSEKVVENEVKGVAPFLMCVSELIYRKEDLL